jgi:MerR family transcriptional regulator, thiopeptide resistance regulator
MYSISQLAKCFNLSRSTLLYYDRKNILKPSGRTLSNYRVYNDNDYRALQTICALREVGIPLVKIKLILGNKKSNAAEILTQRLFDLNTEIHALRKQQRLIASLLGNKKALNLSRTINKDTWIEILRAAGLDEKAMLQWHQAFEKNAPNAHQDFLESLGLNKNEIKKIRHWAMNN